MYSIRGLCVYASLNLFVLCMGFASALRAKVTVRQLVLIYIQFIGIIITNRKLIFIKLYKEWIMYISKLNPQQRVKTKLQSYHTLNLTSIQITASSDVYWALIGLKHATLLPSSFEIRITTSWLVSSCLLKYERQDGCPRFWVVWEFLAVVSMFTHCPNTHLVSSSQHEQIGYK